MRTAIYCRLSIDRTGDGESVERQEAACRALVEGRGWTVAEVFTDRDLSAFKRVSRPAYDRMLRGLADRRFEAVCVFKLDRLTRRFTETGTIVRALEDAGAVLVSVNDSIDTSTAMGQAIMGVLVAQAETESRNTSLRVASAADATAARGEPHKGGSRTFGYTRSMEFVPEEAAIGREMAKRVLAGESLRQIAFDLNRRGVKTSTGHEWHASRVSRWLQSPAPAGFRTHHGVEIEGTWEPIIDPELRLRIMQTIAARGRAGSRDQTPKHLLAGLVYCGKCGGRMKSMGWIMKDGKSFPRYACVKQPAHKNCGGVNASEKSLDAFVVGELIDFLSSAELAPMPDARRAEELRSQVESDTASMLELTRARFIEHTIGPDEFETVRAELQERIRSNEATLAAWEREAESRVAILRPGDRASLEAWWADHGLEDRRAALGHAVEWVKVFPAKHRGGNVFDTSRVKIEFSAAVYRRAYEWADSMGGPLTDEQVAEARDAWDRMREAGEGA